MLKLLSFGDRRYKKSQITLQSSALKHGVDEVSIKNELDVAKNKDFMIKNRYILRQKRGYGYWLWKPYLINQALNSKDFNQNKDNILFYCDSGVEILQDLRILVDKMEILEGELLPLFFHIDHINLHYVKKAVYKAMDIKDEELCYYKKANQIAATYMFLPNTDFSKMLVKEWFNLCQMPFLITDNPSPKLGEFEGFIDHRHDQAILSMLVCKYKLKTLRDPSQFGNAFKDRAFQQIFNLHRKRNKPWFKRQKVPFQDFFVANSKSE